MQVNPENEIQEFQVSPAPDRSLRSLAGWGHTAVTLYLVDGGQHIAICRNVIVPHGRKLTTTPGDGFDGI